MALSGTFHLNSNPGCTLSDRKCVSNFALSRRSLPVLPSSFCLDHKLCVEKGRLNCVYKSSSFVCRASSGGYRRNPDFSRLNKHGYRGRNRQSEEKDDFDIDNNSDMLSSRNGPLLSLSNSPKFQATSSPGPREKEIVELFRKVQAQLRARAAAKKEDKKIEEASKGQGKESETVDSLLKLLRKHSGEQSKKKVGNFGSHGDNSYPVVDRQDRNEYVPNSRNNASSFTRPTSSFRKKSPVPRSKPPPAYSSEADFDQESSYSVTWTQKKGNAESYDEPEAIPEAEVDYEPEYELEPEQVIESELKPETEPSSLYQEEDGDEDEDDVTLDVLSESDEDSDEEEEAEKTEEDLSTLKLTELRGIAKSRGLKGFSKMKKAELVELLGSNSS